MSLILPDTVTIISSPPTSFLRSSYTDIGTYSLVIMRQHTHDSPLVIYRSLDVRVSIYFIISHADDLILIYC